MKKSLARFSLVFLLGFLLAGCNAQPAAKKDEGIVLTQSNGREIHLSQLNGRLLLLNYWATWCNPCYKEIPVLNAFARKHRDKILVVGVSYDPLEPAVLSAAIKKMRIKFPTLASDPARELGIKQIPGLPVSYMINAKGEVVKELAGLQTEKSLEAALKSLL